MQSPKFSFGTSGRSVMNKTLTVPGPGQYSLTNITGKEGNSNSIH